MAALIIAADTRVVLVRVGDQAAGVALLAVDIQYSAGRDMDALAAGQGDAIHQDQVQFFVRQDSQAS